MRPNERVLAIFIGLIASFWMILLVACQAYNSPSSFWSKALAIPPIQPLTVVKNCIFVQESEAGSDRPAQSSKTPLPNASLDVRTAPAVCDVVSFPRPDRRIVDWILWARKVGLLDRPRTAIRNTQAVSQRERPAATAPIGGQGRAKDAKPSRTKPRTGRSATRRV